MKNHHHHKTEDWHVHVVHLTFTFCISLLFLTWHLSSPYFTKQGNGATDGCCSKCWRDMQKSKEQEATAVATQPQQPKPVAPAVEEETKSVPMETEPTLSSEQQPQQSSEAPAEVAAEVPKKKKVKKKSYKNMMASMMNTESKKDSEKEKEAIQKVTGGGAFTKIEKI